MRNDKPNIIDVIGQRIELRKSGREHAGRCPFHEDNTPSLSVNGEKGVAYCFGCQWSGDVFDFVMAIENTDFKGALALLGIAAGKIKRPRSPDPMRQRAEIICRWANEQTSRVNQLLREIGQKKVLAAELGWGQELSRLSHEWEILVVLAEDLQDPHWAPILWESREPVENLLKEAEPGNLPVFPPLTPEYVAQVRSHAQ